MPQNHASISEILINFGLNPNEYSISSYGSGHINRTFLVKSKSSNKNFILQSINHFVFKDPYIIANNIDHAGQFLKVNFPDYQFIETFKDLQGNLLFKTGNEYWRLSAFVTDSYSINSVNDPKQAFDAAAAFGKLTNLLHAMPISGLGYVIPDFHNLKRRYQQFEEALKNGNKNRVIAQNELIDYYLSKKNIVNEFNKIDTNTDYPIRLIHHDSKINNVLFSKKTGKSLAICDLDTLMPGRIFSDVGDMVRTYTSKESEESTDFENVLIRLEYFEALIKGYLSELKNNLTLAEKESLFYAGPILIYMQGLRFLTDYLNDDVYYPIKYSEHNLMRALNQKILLEDYFKKSAEIIEIINFEIK